MYLFEILNYILRIGNLSSPITCTLFYFPMVNGRVFHSSKISSCSPILQYLHIVCCCTWGYWSICRALELGPNLTSHKKISTDIFQKVLKPDYIRISFIIFHIVVITENWIFYRHVFLSYFTSFFFLFQSVGKETISVTYSSHLLFWFQDDFHRPTYCFPALENNWSRFNQL